MAAEYETGFGGDEEVVWGASAVCSREGEECGPDRGRGAGAVGER